MNFNTSFFAVRGMAAAALISGSSFLFTGCQKETMEGMAGQEAEAVLETRLAPGTDPIAQIAIDQGFSELVGALAYVDSALNTGLVDLFLNGTDQYTVFAPTNAAFQNLYTTLEVDDIHDLDPNLVLSVLQYHVVEGRRAANSVVPPNRPRRIQTLLGVTFSVNSSAQITAVGNTANIIAPNVSASNGIIHVIDAVILPIQL